MSMSKSKHQMTLNEDGEDRLLRIAHATAFLSELISGSCYGENKSISGEGVAALLSLLSEQMEDVVGSNKFFHEDMNHDRF